MEDTQRLPPYGSYAVIMSTFLGGLGAAALLAARRRRTPHERPLELALLGLASFKLARTLAHDQVTSFLREPFVEGSPPAPDGEHPLPTGGMRQAVGELVTCSRCIGTWAAAGLVALDVLVPRLGRMLSWSLAVGGLNDWLQAGFEALRGVANRAQG